MRRVSSILSPLLVLTLAAAGSAQVTLKRKQVEQTQSVSEITSKTRQILTIAGMDIEQSSESVIMMSWTNGQRDAQGNLPVTQKFESLFTQLFLPGGIELTFDSANPIVEHDVPQLKSLLEMWNAMAGYSFTMILDKNGKAVEVKGNPEVLENLDEMARALLKNQLDPVNLKQAANQELGKLPTQPVRVGDTWTRTEVAQLGGGQTMTFQNRYKYLGPVVKDDKTLERISVTSESVEFVMDADSPSPLKVVQSDLKVESSDGTILFDRELGDEVESSAKFRILGDVTFSANGQELPGQLDLTIESKSVRQE